MIKQEKNYAFAFSDKVVCHLRNYDVNKQNLEERNAMSNYFEI